MANYDDVFEAAGKQYNVDPKLLKAMMAQESSGNPGAVSAKGATGLMQLMPATAKEMGVTNLNDPVQNIMGGARYMSQMLDKYGDLNTALAAYNAGPGAVDKAGGIPKFPETQDYVRRISAKYQGNSMAQSTLPGLPPIADSASAGNDPFSKLIGGSMPAAAPSAPAVDGDPFSKLMAATTQAQPAAQPAQQPQPGDKPGGVMSFLAGVGRGVQETALGGQQLLGHALSNFDATRGAGNWLINDANKGLTQGASDVAPYASAHPTATGAGQVAGSIAATAPLGVFAPEAAGATFAGRIGVGAGMGAASNMLTPIQNDSVNNPNFASQKAMQALTGAAVGGVANPLLHAIGGAISPTIGAAQQKLLDAGVPLTPGQIKGGNWAKVEDMATSLPGVGSVIRNSQQRALQGYNTATYDKVLEPLGVKFSDVANGAGAGSEGVAAVKKTISNAYDNTLSQMTFKPDGQFQQGLQNLASMAQSLPSTEQKQFLDAIQRQVVGKINPTTMSMDGQTLKQVQSELGRLSRNWLGDPSADKRNLGAAVGEVKNLIDQSLSRNNPPELSNALQNANAAYANYVRLRGAAGSMGAMNNDGVFTAAQLQNAVRGADKSVGKGATATGNALMQDWSSAGQSVLGNKYPDSGTAGRSMLGYLLGGGAFAAPGAILPTLAGAGVASLPYTQTGNKLAAMLLTQRPGIAAPLGRAVIGSAPFSIPAANILTNSIGQPK